jgi:hypothetical protein
LRVNKLIGSSSGADTFDETGGGWESNLWVNKKYKSCYCYF